MCGIRQHLLVALSIFLVLLVLTTPVSAATSTRIDETYDYTDATSDLHSPSDIGTHDIFSDLQGYGSLYDAMTEANTGSAATNYQDYVDALSDLHTADDDIGSHDVFSDLQDYPTNIDVMTESAPTGGSFDIDTVESLGESTYSTDTNWQQKCSITIAPASGTKYYVVIASASLKQSAVAAGYASRGRVIVDDTTTKYQLDTYVKDTTDYVTLFCCYYVEVTYPDTEQVDIEYSTSSTSNTVSIQDARIIAIGFSSAIEAYDEDLTRITDTDTTYTTLSSVTVTPSGTETYIIIASFVYDISATTSSVYARLYNGASALQEDLQEGVNAAQRNPFAAIRYVSISSSTTYSIQARSESSGSTNGAAYGHIVVIDTDFFNQVEYNSATGSTTPSVANTWETKVSNSYTAVADYYLIIGSCQYRSASTSYSASTRLYYNSGTTDNDIIQEDKDTTDWHSSAYFVYYSYSAGAKEDRIQMWMETGATSSDFQQAWLFALQMAPPSTPAQLDLEVGWTSAPYSETNEYLCIYTGSMDYYGENLRVDIWDSGSSQWVNLEDDLVASTWNNYSISSYLIDATVEIRFTGTDETTDAVQSDWEINCVLLHCWSSGTTNYELDLEIGWTAADYDESYEYLCIYPVTSTGWPSEDIKVNIWTGSWTNVFSDLTPDQWNNVSIASYLTDATIEVQFLGGTETSDTTQSTWNIDAVLIHTYSLAYAQELGEVLTLDDTMSTAVGRHLSFGEVNDVYESVSTAAAFSLVLGEIVGIFESISTSASFVLTLFEELGIFESIATGASLVISLFEILGLAESVSASRLIILSLGDLVSVYETFITSASFVLSLGELIPIFETIATAAAKTILFGEGLGIFETIATGAAIHINFGELLTLFESVAKSRIVQLALGEALPLTESVITAAAFVLVGHEILDIFESIVMTPNIGGIPYNVLCYDVLPLADTFRSYASFTLRFVDSLDLDWVMVTTPPWSPITTPSGGIPVWPGPVGRLPPIIEWMLPTSEFPFVTWFHVLIAAALVTAYKIQEKENKRRDAAALGAWTKRESISLGRWLYDRGTIIKRYIMELFE